MSPKNVWNTIKTLAAGIALSYIVNTTTPAQTISTEQISTKDSYKLTRLQLDSKKATFKFDYKPENNGNNPADMMSLTVKDIEGIDATIYKNGNGDRKDIFYFQAAKVFKSDDNKILVHGGIGVSRGNSWGTWIGGQLDNEKYRIESIFFSPDALTAKTEKKFFISGSAEIADNYFVGYGNNDGKHVVDLGLINLEDVGNVTGISYDPRNDAWFFKSQTATGEVNKIVYSTAGNKMVHTDQTIASFYPQNLNNSVSKTANGLTLKLQGSGDDKNTTLEVMPGFAVDGYGFGVGYTTTNTGIDGITAEVYKEIKLSDNASISIDGYWNNMKQDGQLLLKGKVEF